MRNLILSAFVCCVMLPFCAFSQDLEVGKNYYFKVTLPTVTSQNKLKENNVASNTQIKSNHIVKITKIENGQVSFTYFDFPTGSAEEEIYNKGKEFSLPEQDFKALTADYFNLFRGFHIGTYTVPIRLRWGKDKTGATKFEFDTDLAIGTTLISRFSLGRPNEHRYLDVSLGVSITKVNLNKDNSRLGEAGTDFENIETLSPTAFTPTIGAVINLAKNVNIGGYVGWDFLSSADNKAEWIFNKKRWYGVGINIILSNTDDRSSSGKGGNTK